MGASNSNFSLDVGKIYFRCLIDSPANIGVSAVSQDFDAKLPIPQDSSTWQISRRIAGSSIVGGAGTVSPLAN